MTDFTPEFVEWPKIPRLNRPVYLTEKIDGTNAAIVISEEVPYGYGDEEVFGPGIMINRAEDAGWDPVYVYAQSRKRVISPEQDNFGFARWVRENARKLVNVLGPGRHFGEWYGSGIQRGYGLTDGKKYFALFNVLRFDNQEFLHQVDGLTTVPLITTLDTFDSHAINMRVAVLATTGSYATGAEGFDKPEGIIAYHKQGNVSFKVTIENDEKGKERGA